MTSFKRTGSNPKKDHKWENRPKPRKIFRTRFIAVDVWQTHFGPVSERAVYEIFAREFGIEPHNMKKYNFSHCVNALRKKEDPDYIPYKS